MMRDVGLACKANQPAQGMVAYRAAKAAGTKIMPSVYNALIALCRYRYIETFCRTACA